MTTRKEQIEAMLRDDPDDPFLRYGLAMEYVSLGDDAEGVRQFGTLRKTHPDYVPAFLQEAQALMRLGRFAEAASILQAGIQVARAKGETHAAEEMAGFLDQLPTS